MGSAPGASGEPGRLGTPEGVVSASAMTRRVIVLAALLVPLHAYWIVKTEVVWAFVHATVLSAFFNVLATLFLVVLINRFVAKLAPRFALSSVELVGLYVLLCAATAVFGHDFLQVLCTLLVYPYRQAALHSGWGSSFLTHIPTWIVVTDPTALKGVWIGQTSPYNLATLRAWAMPLLAWLGVVLTLVWTMLCLTSLLRRRWTDEERLSFPLVQIPLELICRQERLLSSRLFWGGFALAAGLDFWNALANAFPSLPAIVLRTNLYPYLTQRPWIEMGSLPICVYPFAVGLACFMPLDLAFSSWFFFCVWKAQTVVRAALGYEPLTGQYMGDQSAGAWLGIGLLALIGARHYAVRILREAFGRDRSSRRQHDSREPLSYRVAFVGLLVGAVLLMAFAWAIGLSLWVAALFFALYFVIIAAATRMRAELGPATHDLYFSGPERVLTTVAGTGPYTARDLTLLSQFHWITRDYRSSAMPHMLEGYRLGQDAGARLRGFVLPIMLVTAWAYVAWFACYLHVMYDRGLTGRVGPNQGWTMLAQESYGRLEGWLGATNRGPDYRVWWQMGGGLTVTALLMAIRQRFIWCPLHPVGYALAGSWTMSYLWCSVLIGWMIKSLLLRYGGIKAYRRAVPLFVGLVLGEFVAGGGLSLYNALTDRITYGFFP